MAPFPSLGVVDTDPSLEGSRGLWSKDQKAIGCFCIPGPLLGAQRAEVLALWEGEGRKEGRTDGTVMEEGID